MQIEETILNSPPNCCVKMDYEVSSCGMDRVAESDSQSFFFDSIHSESQIQIKKMQINVFLVGLTLLESCLAFTAVTTNTKIVAHDDKTTFKAAKALCGEEEKVLRDRPEVHQYIPKGTGNT